VVYGVLILMIGMCWQLVEDDDFGGYWCVEDDCWLEKKRLRLCPSFFPFIFGFFGVVFFVYVVRFLSPNFFFFYSVMTKVYIALEFRFNN
jgi:hypothetical protein